MARAVAIFRSFVRLGDTAWRRQFVSLAACAILFQAGCQAFHRKPVAENMVTSRQIALRGLDAKQRGKWDEAESMFRSALEVCPEHDRAHAGFAEVLWQRGARDVAIAHMEQAVRLSGGDPDLLVELGRMHLDQGEHAAAAHRVEQALRSRRDLASAWQLRGDVQRERGDLDDALGCYHRALGYQENCLEAQLAIADIYQMQLRPQRALATLEAAADRYVSGQVPAEICLRQGFAQKALGRHEDAVKSFLAGRTAPDTRQFSFELAEAQLLAGDISAAQLTVADSLQESPQDPKMLRLSVEIGRRQQHMAASDSTTR